MAKMHTKYSYRKTPVPDIWNVLSPASLIMVIIGLVSFIVGIVVDAETVSVVFKELGAVLLISGTVSILQQNFNKKKERQDLGEILKIRQDILESGLMEIFTDTKDFSFRQPLKSSRKFIAIMNDGRRWVDNNLEELKERFNTKGTETVFFLVDPDGLFIPALAKKTDYSEERLKEKIEETVNNLNNAFTQSGRKGSLSIHFLKNYPTESVYYFDNEVVVSQYQNASGKSTVPALKYSYKAGTESIADFLYRDLEEVKKESRLIYVDGQKPREDNKDDS